MFVSNIDSLITVCLGPVLFGPPGTKPNIFVVVVVEPFITKVNFLLI